MYRKWKKEEIVIERYAQGKLKFRELCKRKEEVKQREFNNTIKEIKSEKDVWKFINKFRKKGRNKRQNR